MQYPARKHLTDRVSHLMMKTSLRKEVVQSKNYEYW